MKLNVVDDGLYFELLTGGNKTASSAFSILDCSHEIGLLQETERCLLAECEIITVLVGHTTHSAKSECLGWTGIIGNVGAAEIAIDVPIVSSVCA